jgi:cytochrome c-type biogenesis protein CcmH/NrfG
MKGSWIKSLVVILICTLSLAGCTKSPQEKRDAFMKSAASYAAEKKFAEAAIQYQNALQIAPDDVNALMGLGEVQIKLMRANEAYKTFSKTVSVDPKNIKAHEYLATMQVLAKKYDLAEKSAGAILKIDPENVNARELLAQTYFQTDRRSEAVQIMEACSRALSPRRQRS